MISMISVIFVIYKGETSSGRTRKAESVPMYAIDNKRLTYCSNHHAGTLSHYCVASYLIPN
jgi:hypothetical protein